MYFRFRNNFHFLKAQSTLKPIAFRCFILVVALCYMLSPLKHSVFDLIHAVSHFVEDHMHVNPNVPTSIFKIHTNDALAQHLNSEEPPLLNHNHTATGKIIPNHSHKVLAVLDLIISTSEEQNEHQKSRFKAEIDKHLVTVELVVTKNDLNSTSKKIWYTSLDHYTYKLPILSPPPQHVS